MHILHGDVLTDKPSVAFGFIAADVRELVGSHTRPRNVCQVLGTVIRLHIETFGRAPNQFFVVICPFKVFLDHRFPFLGAHGRKFLEESLFFFHNKLIFLLLILIPFTFA